MICARCVARDLHKITSGPLERTCWRWFAAQRGDCKKSRTAPSNVIIILYSLPMSIFCSRGRKSPIYKQTENLLAQMWCVVVNGISQQVSSFDTMVDGQRQSTCNSQL